jgi:hypothetical protein
LERLAALDEPVVFDHFETFVFSQDDRLGIGTPVGQRSWFVFGADPAPHRRTGRRSLRKRGPTRDLPEPTPNAYARSTRRVTDLLRSLSGGELDFVTDGHPGYDASHIHDPHRLRIHRRVYPNPPRGPTCDLAAARERDREMFAVDLLHKIWRHSQAHHRRRSIAFGRRSNAVLERALLLVVWRNFVKGVSERTNDPTTPAMRIGLTAQPLTWRQVLGKRLFPRKTRLPRGWKKIYRREWITPAVGRNLRHDLAHAF